MALLLLFSSSCGSLVSSCGCSWLSSCCCSGSESEESLLLAAGVAAAAARPRALRLGGMVCIFVLVVRCLCVACFDFCCFFELIVGLCHCRKERSKIFYRNLRRNY